ncbi:hypothetical protein AURDEDRAFT_166307 [Auricularia subglabra TFB-10046 SS5]|uniref:F-box domain-containing protein n=1 Tax=Auricularia subglabra (strain TFB-10046 / SS5) TaxID=717982 RepID=J0DDK1_AURST|nr:hypothetical protein AURDEDRAFT_166307 [Auricularia subglabra TFB-10046 SS5]
MNHHIGSNTLPVELISLVFDSLSLQELLCASRVSKFWRAVAFRHSTFWRDVTLSSLSTAALDCFHARIGAGSNRSVIVNISLPEVALPARLQYNALPLLTHNLYRIEMLFVEIDPACDTDIFTALKCPAPRLNTFHLARIQDTRPSDALPVDLFASQAPNLRDVHLIDVELFADRLPPAFSSVTELSYCFHGAQSFPTALFAHCKLLRSLTIYGRCCSLSPDEDPEISIDSRRLESVDVALFAGGFGIMRHLPCASIADICTTILDQESAELLLSHLRGRLDVHIYKAPPKLLVQFRSRDTGMQRAFACVPDLTVDARLPPVYAADHLVSRIYAIHCSATFIALLPSFHTLPSCTRVVLSHAEDWSDNLPRHPLSVPALERVEILSEASAHLSADALVEFLDRTLDPVARKVQVALTGVVLDGDIAVLGERFVVSGDK